MRAVAMTTNAVTASGPELWGRWRDHEVGGGRVSADEADAVCNGVRIDGNDVPVDVIGRGSGMGAGLVSGGRLCGA